MRSCLIVDDSTAIRSVLIGHVKDARKGFDQIYEAADAATAMAAFREKAPDLVFLDMMMAGDLGVLRMMLAEKPDVPVVVVTGMTGAQPELVEAISLGAVAALRKPVSAEDIKRVLDHVSPDRERMDYFG